MARPQRIAVIGGGIMGCTTALLLARRSQRVLLLERADAIMSGASRWNEGKIHLGFLYAGDPTLATARAVLPGAMCFKPVIESLIGEPLQGLTAATDHFLVHRDSVANLEATQAYARQLLDLITAYPEGAYLQALHPGMVRTLTAAELRAITPSEGIVGGIATPEMSVNTQWLGDRLAAAVAAEPNIEVRTGHAVATIDEAAAGYRLSGSGSGSGSDGFDDERFRAVVNATWESRLPLDLQQGIEPTPGWSHRYRVSLFAQGSLPEKLPSAVICTGPFGDIKSYGDNCYYLSWYHDGLLVDATSLQPPAPPVLAEDEEARTIAAIFTHLGAYFPQVSALEAGADRLQLRGGWVFANGRGALSDPGATLHRRDRIGLHQQGRYISADTGKYSMAPYYALRIAELLSE